MLRKPALPSLRAGFTLIEVLIALVVLAVSSMALFSSLAFSKRLQTQAVHINEAGEAANAVIEAFRRVPYLVLEDAVPEGVYHLEDLGIVYDSNYVTYNLIGSGMATYLRSKLNQNHLAERIVVEQSLDAIRVTVTVVPDANPQQPLAQMIAFIAKNGINFR